MVPEITEHPVEQNITITNPFSLSCGANGYPIPNITWLLNRSEVDLQISNETFSSGSGSFLSIQVEEILGLRSVSSRLSVSMAMTNDSGNYTCLIVSPVSEYGPVLTQPALILVQGTLSSMCACCICAVSDLYYC